MRTINSIKNAIMSIIASIITIIFGFITQKVFLDQLGVELLGLNSLFTSIMSMMAIAELGFGVSILYNLYKPIAEDNKEQIKSLMNFYKKSYHCIAVIILLVGLCILPFLNTIVGKTINDINIHIVFMLFVGDTIASYLLSYKRSLLYAYQENYIIDTVHIIYILLVNVFQIILLYLTRSFILVLIVKIICRFLENIIISEIVNRRFPYIKEKNIEKISKNILADIKKKVKSLLFHRIGGIVVLGSDSIIITKFLGIATMGIYSNYNIVLNAINNLLTQILSAITASVGNLLVTENSNKTYNIYKKISFANFLIYSFATIGIYTCIQPLIKVWVGENYLIAELALIMICINFYFQGQRNTINVFKNAAGIFYEDRYIPLVEATVNLVASIILVKIFGLAGVFMGTIISVSVLFLYSYPKYVYKTLFNKNRIQYIKEIMGYFVVMIVTAFIINLIISNIIIKNLYMQLLINVMLCTILFIVINFILFFRTEEFVYYKKMFYKLIFHK